MSTANMEALTGMGAAVPPAFDYYGRTLCTDDVVMGEPWAMLGFPAELAGVSLRVAGQTPDGMLVVTCGNEGSLFRLRSETVTLTQRDGVAATLQSDEWWASVIAAQTPGQPMVTCGYIANDMAADAARKPQS